MLNGILPGDWETCLSSMGGPRKLLGDRESDNLRLVEGGGFGVTGEGGWLCTVPGVWFSSCGFK